MLPTQTATQAPMSLIETLRNYRVPVSVPEAVSYLQHSLSTVSILGLYHHYFPQEFAASTAARLPLQKRANERGLAWSDAEIEFFGLVNEQLFPLNDFALDWEEREMIIPLEVQSMEWWNRELDGFRLGWQFLFKLVGTDASEDLLPNLDGHVQNALDEVLWQMQQTGRGISRGSMEAACAPAPAPYCHATLAIEMIEHTTGNVFFDMTSEDYWDTQWCVSAMDSLILDWKKGREMDGKVADLLDELETGPKAQMRLLALWQSAIVTTTEETEIRA